MGHKSASVCGKIKQIQDEVAKTFIYSTRKKKENNPMTCTHRITKQNSGENISRPERSRIPSEVADYGTLVYSEDISIES